MAEKAQLNKAKNNNDVFFTKKKIFTMLALVVVVICAVVTSVSIFKVDLSFIGSALGNSFTNNKLASLWFLLCFLFPLYFVFLRAWSYSYKLKKNGKSAKWYEWISFSLICGFLNAVTPFSIGSEPYCIYWLKKKGLSLQTASVIVASNTILFPIVQILITWPSFFVLCGLYGDLSVNSPWMIIFWFSFMGLIFDILGLLSLWLLSYSKNVHYFIGILISKFKKLFKMEYSSKEDIKMEFKQKASFQREFAKEMKDIKFMLLFGFGTIVWNFIYYFSVYFAIQLLAPVGTVVNFWDIYHYTNVSLTANNFIPIPGGEGTLQYILSTFIFYGNSIQLEEVDLRIFVDNVVFTWRAFTYYLMAIMGFIPFIWSMVENMKNTNNALLLKKNKTQYDKSKVNSFSIIIPAYNCASFITKTLDSLVNTNYDKSKVQVIIIDDASTDDSVKVIKKYIKDYPWMKLYKKTNGQWGSVINYARNKKLPTNDFVSILDSDDFYNPEIFNIYNKMACNHTLLFGSFSRWNGKRKIDYVCPFYRMFTRTFVDKSKMKTPICLPLIFTVRKEAFYKIHDLTEGVPFQDTDYLTQLISHTETARFTTKNIASYFYNRANNTKTQEWNQKRFDAQIIACEKAIANDSQELVSFFVNEPGFRKMLNKNNYKFTIQRKFILSWLPHYLSWAYAIMHWTRNKKYFVLVKKDKTNNK
ncbi:MAG: glycosyltransferase [Mycoplasma sp.]